MADWRPSRLYRFFQLLGRPERDFLAGLDLDGLAGPGMPAHPGGTALDLKDAKAGQTNLVTVLEVPGGERHQCTQCRLSLLFR